ncbi:MAG: hypothetical protein COV71_03690 [Candidatus Omnitrophica bacterium CG11_big_fil_rev_8_21_14_0_20_41_12]|nr:MAG: hypothetical protein COV71_03690 [Candidatus Omnitrophica bacterium CG11_big_fil_rev_8_21_14_0_20_41_12]
MSAFIRTIQGEIFGIDHNKKHFSLVVKEFRGGISQNKKIDFLLDANVGITDISNQQIKLVGLKADDKVEIGYIRDKSQRIAQSIKIIS